MSDATLYDDVFRITGVNSQKYDRVSRITCNSGNGDTALTLDINSEIYPLSTGENISLAIASTLNLDGTKDDRGWRDLQRSGDQTLADQYEYVCRGKVYRIEEGGSENTLKVYVSFGGLLLYMEGPWRRLTNIKMEHVYLLVKK